MDSPTVPKKGWSPTQMIADHPSIAGIVILVLVILVVYLFAQSRGWLDSFIGGPSGDGAHSSSSSVGCRKTKSAPPKKSGGRRSKEDEDVDELIDIINS